MFWSNAQYFGAMGDDHNLWIIHCNSKRENAGALKQKPLADLFRFTSKSGLEGGQDAVSQMR